MGIKRCINNAKGHTTSTSRTSITRLHTLSIWFLSISKKSFHQHSRIDLAVSYIIKGKPDVKLGRENLKKLFFFAIAVTHFSFMVKFYDQIDGVAMGSPPTPVLANLVMAHHEKRRLENCNWGIEFYRRYVDDTFGLIFT